MELVQTLLIATSAVASLDSLGIIAKVNIETNCTKKVEFNSQNKFLR